MAEKALNSKLDTPPPIPKGHQEEDSQATHALLSHVST